MKRWMVVSRNCFSNNPEFSCGFYYTKEAARENAEYRNLNYRGYRDNEYKVVEIEIPDSIWDNDDGDQRTEMGR